MAGAIPDTIALYNESAIPSLLFHGTDDRSVPYATAPHHFCDKEKPGYLILHGSNTIAKKLDLLEVPYWLHTTCGGAHEMANKPMTVYFDEIVEFCNTFVIQEKGDTRHTIIEGVQNKKAYKTYNFCSRVISFSDFIEAQSVWYNFQLTFVRAKADYGKYLARIERLVGRSLTEQDSASIEANGKE